MDEGCALGVHDSVYLAADGGEHLVAVDHVSDGRAHQRTTTWGPHEAQEGQAQHWGGKGGDDLHPQCGTPQVCECHQHLEQQLVQQWGGAHQLDARHEQSPKDISRGARFPRQVQAGAAGTVVDVGDLPHDGVCGRRELCQGQEVAVTECTGRDDLVPEKVNEEDVLVGHGTEVLHLAGVPQGATEWLEGRVCWQRTEVGVAGRSTEVRQCLGGGAGGLVQVAHRTLHEPPGHFGLIVVSV